MEVVLTFERVLYYAWHGESLLYYSFARMFMNHGLFCLGSLPLALVCVEWICYVRFVWLH
jgi:hypothetical protein